MSDGLFKLFGGAVLCVFVGMILKKESPDSAVGLRMAAGVMLAIACIGAMSPILGFVDEIGESVGAAENISEAVGVLLKVLGVSVLTHICATVCRDSGEGSIAYYVELGGKIEIMILSLPLLKDIVALSLELLEMS